MEQTTDPIKINSNSLITDLAEVMAEDVLVVDKELLRVFECDGLSAYRELPLVAVLPATVAEIKAILAICKKHKVPVVTRGAGTGLSGGALPLAGSVLLVLSRMHRILDINDKNKTVTVEPGVRNSAVSEAAAKYGLYYAPDPSSQIACSIGGNVAENAGGLHCLKYGLTINNVLAAKVLTMDGELLELDSESNVGGLDLLALLTGSEGLLGVVVEITLKLLVQPEFTKLVMAGFARVGDSAEAVAKIIEHGIIPAGLEMMDELAIQAAEDFVRVGYPLDAKALLLCELDGTETDVHETCELVRKILGDTGATSIKIAENEAERMKMWQGRKSSFPAVGRISPDYYCMDGTIPRREVKNVLNRISELSNQYGLRVANVFHAGDGNLHPLILYDANKPGELEKTEEFGRDTLKLCVDVGGTVTGEHGAGVEKLDSMCDQFEADELEQFFALKHAFDPDKLLNPGKAVPTLHRCAELGAMHVHHGKLPFPELDRF